MQKRVSIDEMVSRRLASAAADGTMLKAVLLDDAADIEVKGYDPDKRAQRFVMSSETADSYGDIVVQNGILLERFLKNPMALAFHRHDAPIGTWTDVRKVNGKPKRTEGVLNLSPAGTTEKIDEVERLLAANAIRACSIGFMPKDMEWIFDDEGRNTYGIRFIESELIECSVVSVPANPDALAKAAGGDPRLAREVFELFLDTYCERSTGGLIVKKPFADAYFEIKERAAPKRTAPTKTAEPHDAESIAERVVSNLARLLGIKSAAQDLVPELVDESVIEPETKAAEPEAPQIVTPDPVPEQPAAPALIPGSMAAAQARKVALLKTLAGDGSA